MPEFRLARLGELGGVFDQELQLLRQAAADDGVVLAKAHRLGLTRQQLLVQQLVDEALQLLRARFAQPLARPCLLQPAHVAFADADRLDRRGLHPLSFSQE